MSNYHSKHDSSTVKLYKMLFAANNKRVYRTTAKTGQSYRMTSMVSNSNEYPEQLEFDF